MYNFAKKIVGISSIFFLIFGNITFGQEGQEIDLNTNNSNTSRYNNTRTNNQNTNNEQYGPKTYQVADESQNTMMCDVAGASRSSLGICRCPEGTKEVDKKCLPCSSEGVCCGIQLNTSIPFIGDCIEFDKKESTENQSTEEMIVTQEEAFPTLMGYLIKILFTIILLGSFIAILAGGVMISAAGPDEQRATKGKKLIIDVVIALAILGASGVILRLINPNFFQ